MPSRDYDLKTFLDETAVNLASFNKSECRDLFSQLINLITSPSTHADVCQEVLSFCSASVLEMIKSSRESLEAVLKSSRLLSKYSNFHVFVDAVTSLFVTLDLTEIDLGALLEAVISGLTAIESQTISLSGSCLIKLLKRDPKAISRHLAEHPDFVAILSADMCAMFSRLEREGVQLAPFIRIVRFCELIMDLAGDGELEEKILRTVENEFIYKIYRSELKQMTRDKSQALKWCNELMKVCHRGNQLLRPLVSEVFRDLDVRNLRQNEDLREILGHERSRPIKEVSNLLFAPENNPKVLMILEYKFEGVIDDSMYREALKRLLNSFEQFPMAASDPKSSRPCSLTDFAVEMFQSDRQILINWLPYCLQVAEIESTDAEMQMYIDISGRINEYLQ